MDFAHLEVILLLLGVCSSQRSLQVASGCMQLFHCICLWVLLRLVLRTVRAWHCCFSDMFCLSLVAWQLLLGSQICFCPLYQCCQRRAPHCASRLKALRRAHGASTWVRHNHFDEARASGASHVSCTSCASRASHNSHIFSSSKLRFDRCQRRTKLNAASLSLFSHKRIIAQYFSIF